MSITRYIKNMPASIKENPAFRSMILACLFLAVANSVLPFYTLYAIRVFSATEAHIALLAGLAILSGAISHIGLGYIVDKFGPRIVALIIACLLVTASTLALLTNSFTMLFVIWVLANIGNNGTILAVSLLLGEVSPTAKLPLYVGVYFTISTAIAAIIVLLLAPMLENLGFTTLFLIVLICGFSSLLINVFILRKRLKKRI